MGVRNSYSSPAAPSTDGGAGNGARPNPGQINGGGEPGTLNGPVERGEPDWPGAFLSGEPGGDEAPGALDPTDWLRWWRHNGDTYLRVGAELALRESVTGSDADEIGLTVQRIRTEIAPALEAVLVEGGDAPIVREALLALARIRRSHGDLGSRGVDSFAEHYLRDGGPAVQEAALLALGVQGDARSVIPLREILDNTRRGRELTGTESVPVRLRAFAAFALGLLGDGDRPADLRLLVVHALLDSLGNERTATREIQVACVLAAGLVPLEFCRNDPAALDRHRMEDDRHLCGGVQLRYLLDIIRDAELDPWVRAHAAPAIGRLALRAPSHFRAAVLEELGARVGARSKEPEYVRQGCVLGIGLFADGDEDELDEEARRLLVHASRIGDPLSRRFALLGLGRAAARPGDGNNEGRGLREAHAYLIGELVRGRGDRKAWAALALGVLGHGRREALPPVADEVRGALRRALARARTPKEAGALAITLGILRDGEAAAEVRASLARFDDRGFRALAALILGLLSDPEGLDPVRTAFLGEECDLHDVPLEVAVGLRLLGDDEVGERILTRSDYAEDPTERGALLTILAELGDPRAITPLLETARDTEQPTPVRTSALHALAGMSDRHGVAWTSTYSTDVLYGILTWTLQSPLEDAWGLFDYR